MTKSDDSTNIDSAEKVVKPANDAPQNTRMRSKELVKKEILSDIRRHIDSVNLEFEFSKDLHDLQEYYRLRGISYKRGLGLKEFSGAEDDYDAISDILIAKDRGKVVGGARLTVSSPSNRIALSFEEPDFMVRDVLPELELENKTYCEVSRLAISPEQRFTYCLEKMILQITQKAIDNGAKYLFNIAPMIQARWYRRIHNNMGCFYVINKDIEVPFKPIFDGLIPYLSISELPKEMNQYNTLLLKDEV